MIKFDNQKTKKMESKKNKSLAFNTLIFIELGVLLFLSFRFHHGGYKISVFLSNSKNILFTNDGFHDIEVSAFLSGLYVVLISFAIIISFLFRGFLIKSGQDSKDEVKKEIVIKESLQEDAVLEKEKEKEVKTPNFLISKTVLSKQKQQAEANKKELAERLKIIQQEKHSSKGKEELEKEKLEKEAAVKNEVVKEKQEQTVSNKEVEEVKKEGVKEETPIVVEDSEIKDFLASKFILPEVLEEIEDVNETYFNEKSPDYGVGEEEESFYDQDGYDRFFAPKKTSVDTSLEEIESKGKQTKGGGKVVKESVSVEKEKSSINEALIRGIFREEVSGLLDETTFATIEDRKRLNEIHCFLKSLKDEIKTIKENPSFSKDPVKQETELKSKFAQLKDMEAEGQLLLMEIDEKEKIASQEKYSKYAIV